MAMPEALVEPRLGQVMGVSWGCSTEELLSVHPELTPERDEPDVTTYSLAQFRVGGDLPARCIFTFWFGELVSVEFTLTEASPEDVDTAAAPLMATFAELAQRTGVGLLRLQEGRTRLEVDRLDARIRLEEVPQ